MSAALRIAGFFVARPAEEVPAERVAAAGRTVVLLAAPGAALPLGVVLAATLAWRVRAPAAVVLGWTPAATGSAAPGRPATPLARRLASSLSARDVPARGTACLVRAVLPADDVEAAAAVRRATAAVPAALPVVIALGGPRGPEVDGLLGAADAVLVAGPPDDAGTVLACAGAARTARRVVSWPIPTAGRGPGGLGTLRAWGTARTLPAAVLS